MKRVRNGIIYGALAGLVLSLFGCGTIGNGKIDSPVTPYQAGRLFVFADVVTQPIQPAEVGPTIDAVYSLANANLGAGMLDGIMVDEIARAYPDATPEFRAVLFNVYDALKARLDFHLAANPDIPSPKVLEEFFRGVRDAEAVYGKG